MPRIIIRPAIHEDDAAIKALTGRCPQEGMVKIIAHRTPTFNTLHKTLDPGAWHLVACDGDQIIGLVGVIHFNGTILGNTYKIAYMLDLKVDLQYRKGLTAHRLIKTAIEKVKASDADMVMVNFLQHNKNPMVFTTGKGGIPKAYHIGSNLVYNIIPWKKLSLPAEYSITEMQKEDILEVLMLYAQSSNKYGISADLSQPKLEQYLDHIKGLSSTNFIVAKKHGKIKAVTALWDDHYYKSYQILHLNTKLRLINYTIKLLSLFTKMPQPLDTKKPMRQLSMRLYAHDRCPEALNALIRYANNRYRGKQYTALNFYCSKEDEMVPYLNQFSSITVGSEMYIFAKDETLYEKLSQYKPSVLLDLVATL